MSHTIDVPGGTATFYDQDELTPRRTRPVEEITLELGDLLDRVTTAHTLAVAREAGKPETVDVNPDLIGPDIVLDRRQARLFRELQDAITWARLQSWTVDLPMPATPEDLLDWPKDLYIEISRHVSILTRQERQAGNTFDISDASLENRNSPTGPSDASAARSGGKGRSKTPKRLHGTGSTTTGNSTPA